LNISDHDSFLGFPFENERSLHRPADGKKQKFCQYFGKHSADPQASDKVFQDKRVAGYARERGCAMVILLNKWDLVEGPDKKAEIQFDETAQTPYFHYYERDPATGDAREHVVWFDDARSMDQKLRLLRDYDLAGSSVWNIMRYFPQLWLVMNSLYTIERNT
jgi:GH18 family chitinase